jgi:hypothetical protein
MAKETTAVNDPAVTTKIDPLVPMTVRELVSVIVTGLVAGLLVTGLAYVLDHFVFSAVLCRVQAPANCNDAPGYAMTVAIIIASIAALAVLVRQRVYRPLLVVLAAAISLWGIQRLTDSLPLYGEILVIGVFFGLAYGLFSWVSRIRSFIFAVIVAVVLVVAIRLALAG